MRRARRLAAAFSALVVAVCTARDAAPGFVPSAALSSEGAVPFCEKTRDCDSSCPKPSGAPARPTSERRACDASGCSFLVARRQVASAPRRDPSLVADRAADVTLASRAGALRAATLAASPPLRVLLATFRN